MPNNPIAMEDMSIEENEEIPAPDARA